jgi:hypothetical protein
MVFGMSLETFTLVHVLISLVAIASGLVVLAGMIQGNRLDLWTHMFLGTTVATSVTGFLFPNLTLTPAVIFGIISMVALAIAIWARYPLTEARGRRKAYVISALFALYLNSFVLIVQSFQKIPFLNALAPTQSEPPFGIAQALLLAGFLYSGWKAVKGFASPRPAAQAARA